MDFFTLFGKYLLMLKGMFTVTENKHMFWKEYIRQCVDIGIGSLPIVVIISFFLGAVTTVQTASQLVSPLVPLTTIGIIVRDSILLEFAPTFISVVMAGKMGSFITSSIGTMRVTEQIDALEVMGVNSLNYLVFPKLVALLLYPFLIGISMFIGISGGYIAAVYGGFGTEADFVSGLQQKFIPFHIAYAFIKTFILYPFNANLTAIASPPIPDPRTDTLFNRLFCINYIRLLVIKYSAI